MTKDENAGPSSISQPGKVQHGSGSGKRGLGLGIRVPPAKPEVDKTPNSLKESSVQIESIDVLKPDVEVAKINSLLEQCNKLNRFFLRRHPLDSKRFDVLNEDGLVLCQLLEYPRGRAKTSLNFILKDSATDKSLMTFTGNAGRLGLSGEIVASYPKSHPDSKEVILGRVKQSTPCCSLRPRCVVLNAEDQPMYNIVDKNPTSLFCPGRRGRAPNFEILQHGGLPTPMGRIDERRLIINQARRSKGSYSHGRRSIAAMSPKPRRSRPAVGVEVGRLSITQMTLTVAPEDVNDNRSLRSHGGSISSIKSLERSLSINPSSREEEFEKPTHDHFCIAFKHSMEYKMKVMMIAAHLLVNDDLVRRSKRCTRRCYAVTLYIFLCIVILAMVGLIVWIVLTSRDK